MDMRQAYSSFTQSYQSADVRMVTALTNPACGQIRHFHILLLDGASLRDLGSVIDPLKTANQLSGRSLYTWSLVSATGQPVKSAEGVQMPVDHPMSPTRKSDCIVVCSGDTGFQAAEAEILSWLRRHDSKGGLIAAASTGAYTLLRAGILRDHEFTVHYAAHAAVEEQYPDHPPSDRMYQKSGRILTSAGGAGILEMMLLLILEDKGSDAANKVSRACLHVYDPEATQSLQNTYRPKPRNAVLARIIDRMLGSIEDPESISNLIKAEPISLRQVERLFNEHFQTSPGKYYKSLRLERARSLLNSTNMTVLEIAVATGFSGTTSFRKAYRDKYSGPLPR
ncbi:Transcriptional regulator GlxA family, contains an amidase domain and an AraC-type DNA-binding HTH domain [Epibacterium ulvae]|uniref:Transcriptional regulator GlxA family, contains an amidase domain and an AraC-type DNA-binding HTH domain n=2 Tax=Epibacterium ulvae TaxID=1156985 RepID=A0A1G5QFB5_9RHOB|nr:Transcriptional regulator GlxA family, contains an amidase domain and an AraC-type DNA-binding HTH domain [Epibacterium ulvae]